MRHSVRALRGFAIFAMAICVWVQNARAEAITMTFGASIPPYAFPDTASGIEVDIIREALALKGHALEPVFVPARRIAFEFIQGKVDAASKDQGEDLTQHGGLYGDVSVKFQDVIFSLEERGLSISDPADLEQLRVVAFQNASKHYADWLSPLEGADNYTETADQTLQVKMLHRGRADVIVADRNIVQYLTKLVAQEGKIGIKPVTITNFADPWGYRPVFKTEALRDDFNAGLETLISSGRYQEIVDNYVN
ncbi:transporter substrate-binding domain-containing protein [uncultured Tateyamaria sp.]|uniref:substrate-binding periplasmic protein n=1 Tax=uncultured Tateyamaria sp. TaxID=455651 RepID=UPI00261DBB4B|nr:transporter substrate-binding domain-containing protein [uncultured Tateyamaria sp.]